jgi:hypothetical protein
VANKILHESVHELAESVTAVVRRLQLCGEGVVITFLVGLYEDVNNDNRDFTCFKKKLNN